MLPAEELAQVKYIPTLPEFVTWIEQKWSDLPCLSDTVNTYTYRQVCDRVARKRALLNSFGLQKGDKVAILDNSTVEAVSWDGKTLSAKGTVSTTDMWIGSKKDYYIEWTYTYMKDTYTCKYTMDKTLTITKQSSSTSSSRSRSRSARSKNYRRR